MWYHHFTERKNLLSLRLFEYKGTLIYLNLVFLSLFLFISFWSCVLIFLSILLHEMGHVYMAKKLGYSVESVFINPFGGGSIIDECYLENNRDSIKIDLAGPLVNIIISFISFVLVLVLPSNIFLFDIVILFLFLNLSLAIINLVPVYPLDGGKILLSLVRIFTPIKKSEIVSLLISIIISLFFFIVSVMSENFILSIFCILFILINLTRLKKNDVKLSDKKLYKI